MYTNVPRIDEEKIKLIAALHGTMNDAIHLANKTFSFQLLPWLLTALNASIFTTYQFYLVLIQFDEENFLRAVNNFIWCLFNLRLIVLIIIRSNDFLDQVIMEKVV